ncbi:hypothetical protein [Roseobacter sp. MH60115]|uniref:hypothetical protein n=1 Tax=Roseobacter sp. MH60115 TaxID=2785324 RepID=UPI0018A2BD4C|nr:hypothetical protein [Roseobacter sp. MH60115]
MSLLRPLHETLTDIADGAMTETLVAAGHLPLRVTSLEMSVPLDVRWAADEGVFQADFPLFRRRTEFDPEPAQLTITLGEVPV